MCCLLHTRSYQTDLLYRLPYACDRDIILLPSVAAFSLQRGRGRSLYLVQQGCANSRQTTCTFGPDLNKPDYDEFISAKLETTSVSRDHNHLLSYFNKSHNDSIILTLPHHLRPGKELTAGSDRASLFRMLVGDNKKNHNVS